MHTLHRRRQGRLRAVSNLQFVDFTSALKNADYVVDWSCAFPQSGNVLSGEEILFIEEDRVEFASLYD